MRQDDDIAEVRETSPLLPRQQSYGSSNSSDPGSASTGNSPSTLLPRAAFVSLATALNNCLWAGSVLIFSLYAPQFNEKLGYRQMQINAVSVATELGMYLPVPVFGFICDRFGPSRLSLLSSVFFGPGYALAAAAYAHAWDYRVMVAAFALIGMGTSSLYFSGVTTCAKNFTGRRGLALALPIAAFGLSSLWQAQLVSYFFTSASPSAAAAAAAAEGGGAGHVEVERVFWFFALSLATVGLVGSVGLRVTSVDGQEDDELDEDGAILAPTTEGEEGEGGGEDGEDKGTNWLNADTRAFLADRNMWWFASGVFLVTGPGEAFINNTGTLIQTLRPSPATSTSATVDPALQVSLIALTSTAARLIAGSVSDYLAPPAPVVHLPPAPKLRRPKRLSCSRMNILFLFAAIMFSGFFVVASGVVHARPELFWLVSSSIGAGYGAVFCLAPTVVSVVWGTRNFGTNWGIISMAPALGAVVYGCMFAGEYDTGAGAGAGADAGACYGWVCVRYSFSAMAASVVLAVAGWGWVWRAWNRAGVVV